MRFDGIKTNVRSPLRLLLQIWATLTYPRYKNMRQMQGLSLIVFMLLSWFNNNMTAFSQQLQNELAEKTGRTFLKNTRWLLVRDRKSVV